MDTLEAEAFRLLESSQAKSTQTTYTRGVAYFDSFRVKCGLSVQWPASVQDVIAFISHLSIEGKSPSSMNTYTSAISYVHKLNGWDDPCKSFIIGKLKEGAKRARKRPDCRRPITLQILRQLLHVLDGICSSNYELVLFRAAYLLAYFGFMRVGELTAISRNNFSHGLSIGDISLSSEAMKVLLHFSETDQRGKSSTLHFSLGPDATLCPVIAMQRFLDMRPKVQRALYSFILAVFRSVDTNLGGC